MPEWLVALISVGASTAVSTIVGIVLKHSFTRYFEKKDKEKKEQEEEKLRLQKFEKEESDKKLIETVDSVVKTHTDPIDEELVRITSKLTKVADGTLDTLRDRILTVYYKCLEKHYRSEYDIANVDHMYKDYVALNGNSFVDDCMQKFRQIPTEKEYEILTNTKTKKSRKSKGSSAKTKKEEKEG